MAMSRQERRSFPRVKKNLPLKIRGGEFDIITETKNLSCAGAYCTADRYLEPMTKLKILMLLPNHSKRKIVNKKVECEGVVIRAENSGLDNKQYNIAIFFSDIKEADRKKISDYVNNHLKTNEA